MPDGTIAQFGHKADSVYWDNLWQEQAKTAQKQEGSDLFVEITKKYLKKDAKILEGGCGAGKKLVALHNAGFDIVGVDYAPVTIENLKTRNPEVPVVLGDVRNLPFKSNEFDGYWSFGVIEHFWEGYSEILAEAGRVLKPSGYIMMTFPSMSLLRRMKVWLGRYPLFTEKVLGEPDSFYQYYLDPLKVKSDLESLGFEIQEIRRIDFRTGLKQELSFAWRCYNFSSRKLPVRIWKIVTRMLEIIFSRMLGHLSLVVAKKM
jgi:SAM-dependent methyltransferase